jgi:hypothetical protein
VIFGWIRLLVMALIGLTIVYFVVGIYSRSVRREKLEKRFDAGGIEGDRAVWIEEGMKAYDRGLKKRLLWLIYIVPLTAMVVTAYLVNLH